MRRRGPRVPPLEDPVGRTSQDGCSTRCALSRVAHFPCGRLWTFVAPARSAWRCSAHQKFREGEGEGRIWPESVVEDAAGPARMATEALSDDLRALLGNEPTDGGAVLSNVLAQLRFLIPTTKLVQLSKLSRSWANASEVPVFKALCEEHGLRPARRPRNTIENPQYSYRSLWYKHSCPCGERGEFGVRRSAKLGQSGLVFEICRQCTRNRAAVEYMIGHGLSVDLHGRSGKALLSRKRKKR